MEFPAANKICRRGAKLFNLFPFFCALTMPNGEYIFVDFYSKKEIGIVIGQNLAIPGQQDNVIFRPN